MSKHTSGFCEIGKPYGMHGVEIIASGRKICGVLGVDRDRRDKDGRVIELIHDEEGWANAELIAEAFNVATETGLTPRQIAEQRESLLEACKKAREWLDGWASASPYIDILDEAIANATAHQSDERSTQNAQG